MLVTRPQPVPRPKGFAAPLSNETPAATPQPDGVAM